MDGFLLGGNAPSGGQAASPNGVLAVRSFRVAGPAYWGAKVRRAWLRAHGLLREDSIPRCL